MDWRWKCGISGLGEQTSRNKRAKCAWTDVAVLQCGSDSASWGARMQNICSGLFLLVRASGWTYARGSRRYAGMLCLQPFIFLSGRSLCPKWRRLGLQLASALSEPSSKGPRPEPQSNTRSRQPACAGRHTTRKLTPARRVRASLQDQSPSRFCHQGLAHVTERLRRS